jgi:hypothetical protein
LVVDFYRLVNVAVLKKSEKNSYFFVLIETVTKVTIHVSPWFQTDQSFSSICSNNFEKAFLVVIVWWWNDFSKFSGKKRPTLWQFLLVYLLWHMESLGI